MGTRRKERALIGRTLWRTSQRANEVAGFPRATAGVSNESTAPSRSFSDAVRTSLRSVTHHHSATLRRTLLLAFTTQPTCFWLRSQHHLHFCYCLPLVHYHVKFTVVNHFDRGKFMFQNAILTVLWNVSFPCLLIRKYLICRVKWVNAQVKKLTKLFVDHKWPVW